QAGQVTQPSQAKSSKSYTVQAGDGLYTVAQELGTSVSELKARYGLTSNLIHPGQVFSTSGSQIGQTSQANQAGQSESTKTYTVQAGDGLYTVAQELGTSVSELKARYGLTSDLIHPGQVFSAAASQTSQPNQLSQANSSKTYTVQAGDGLYTVAQELGTSVSELKARYGLTSNLIHPGQVFTSGSQVTSQPSQATGSAYTVQPGDTLWKIARQNGLTVDQLKAMNGLESDQIYLGQALNFTGQPVASQPSQAINAHVDQPEVTNPVQEQPASHTISQPTSNQVQQTYTIQAGDNLYRIAQNNGVSLDDLVAANGFENEQALILPGQAITIPQ
ncbi:LysM repeat-containing protein, partial [Aerococcus urinaehominis]